MDMLVNEEEAYTINTTPKFEIKQKNTILNCVHKKEVYQKEWTQEYLNAPEESEKENDSNKEIEEAATRNNIISWASSVDIVEVNNNYDWNPDLEINKGKEKKPESINKPMGRPEENGDSTELTDPNPMEVNNKKLQIPEKSEESTNYEYIYFIYTHPTFGSHFAIGELRLREAIYWTNFGRC
ncbi:11860_t:CDS:2 [Scutellospora calospora]|uniref:11860_t:CDS:1 n=1 Tax=Scutellospora calospora TaxID=85575 RepID=A0ACA9KYQ8_9GLOM|nr:11860_t:CDS:2 [Scutellospora calospora]